MVEFVNDNGAFPADNSEAALYSATSYAGSYVQSISVTGAVISVQYGNQANALISGETVTLTAVVNDGSLTWICTNGGTISKLYLPSSCK